MEKIKKVPLRGTFGGELLSFGRHFLFCSCLFLGCRFFVLWVDWHHDRFQENLNVFRTEQQSLGRHRKTFDSPFLSLPCDDRRRDAKFLGDHCLVPHSLEKRFAAAFLFFPRHCFFLLSGCTAGFFFKIVSEKILALLL